MMTQQLQAQRAKQIAAAKLQGAERDKSMKEYLLSMQKTMVAMQLMKPRQGASMQEQQDWVEEQQKLHSASHEAAGGRAWRADARSECAASRSTISPLA